MKLRLMSYNIQHGALYLTDGRIDLAKFSEVIRSFAADIIVLNEVRAEGENAEYTAQTETIAGALGYHYAFCKAFDVPGGGPYGNAILSKYPFTVSVTPIPAPATLDNSPRFEPRCVLRAVFDAGEFRTQPFTVFGTHFGLSDDEAACAAKTVRMLLDAEKNPCAFMGDLNLPPESPILLPIREKMRDSADAFDTPKLSHPSDNPDIKIDYLFVSDGICVLSADIPPVTTSDHRPYIADIAF